MPNVLVETAPLILSVPAPPSELLDATVNTPEAVPVVVVFELTKAPTAAPPFKVKAFATL